MAVNSRHRQKEIRMTYLGKFNRILFVSVMFIFLSVIPGFGGDVEKPLRIGYLQSDLHQLACWVALEKGFYFQEGVDVEVAGIFKAGPEEMMGFASGSLDIGYVGEAPATMAVANKTADVVVLAQVNTEGSALVVRRHSIIKQVSDLIGRTVAIPGHAQVQDLLLRKILIKYNVDQERVNIIVLKPPEMIGALKTSQIDAFIAWEPYVAKAETMGVGSVLINSSDVWPGHPCCVLVADSTVLKKRMQAVKGVVQAHVRATNFINRNKEAAIKIGVKYTGMDEDTVSRAMKRITYTVEPSVDGEIEYINFLNKLSYLNISDPRGFAHRFIHVTLLKDINKK
jgi:NitT/TauT family transport system substrate-binding protein